MNTQTGSVAPDEAALIVELFARRQEVYAEDDVFRLTRVAPARLQAAVAEGEIEPVTGHDGRWFAWGDVAHLAFLRWTARMVTNALRHVNATNALPLLNQTRTIRLELPIYQIRLLHWYAVDRSEPGAPALNASDVAAGVLHDLADNTDDDAELEVPGFIAARNFPESTPSPQIVKASCVYCGTASVREGHAACAECEVRHEPPAHTSSGRSEGS